jgi:cysteine desulfurase
MKVRADQVTYLDNNATTRIAPEVFEAMVPFLTEFYGNPSSVHTFGSQVAPALATAREQVAALFHCDPKEIVFTSCGTESDNAAIASALKTTGKKHIVTTAVEHSAIINQCEALEKTGHLVTYLPVRPDGTLDLAHLENAITDDTAIVSIMWANNETGVVFPVEEAAALCKRKGVLFHTDAVQVPGKLPIDLAKSKIDFLSISGHKLHAPKGVGALFVRRRTRFAPHVIGGGQERGKRGGTENVASLIGLGRAAQLAVEHLGEEQTRVKALRDRLEAGLLERVPDLYVNGAGAERLPNTVNVAIDFVEAEAVLLLLDREGIACSSGSACTTGSLDPSHVLKAMGLTPARARGAVRLSLSRYNTEAEVDRLLATLPPIVEKLRAISPLNREHPDNDAYDVESARAREEAAMAKTMASINE